LTRTRRWTCPAAKSSAHGQKNIHVFGPVPEVEAEIAALHIGFWKRDPS